MMPRLVIVRVRMHVDLALLIDVRVRVFMPRTSVFLHDEPGRRHSGAQDRLGGDRIARHRQAAERRAQGLDRQTRIEKCAEQHVAGNTGEAVQVEHASH